MPQAAKFGPGLIVQKLHRKQADGDANLSVSANAFADTMGKSSGIRVIVHKGKKSLEEVRSLVASAPFPPMHIPLIRDANSNCLQIIPSHQIAMWEMGYWGIGKKKC
jgi:hypothetical protein